MKIVFHFDVDSPGVEPPPFTKMDLRILADALSKMDCGQEVQATG